MKRKFISLGAGIWTQKADMPTARWVTGSTVVDEKIYVIGGNPAVATSGEATAAVEEYDPATDTWTRRVDMSNARDGVRAAAVDGIIYAIGGWDGNKLVPAVGAYDPASDKWAKKTDIPTARILAAIAVVDGKIYVIGGRVGEVADLPNLSPVSTVEEFDPGLSGTSQR